MPRIAHVRGRQIFDSRGNPTIEVDVVTDDGVMGRAAVPSGASTGENEAVELRDADPQRFDGKGVMKAVGNVNGVISSALAGMEVHDQAGIDRTLIELDDTANKGNLGANSILGASLAAASADARTKGIPLFRKIGGEAARELPVPMMNIINGGRHADNNVDMQEFMIVPAGADSFSEALRMGVEIFHTLKSVLKSAGYGTSVGDEGGFAPDLRSNEEAVEVILKAIEAAGYRSGEDVFIALDPATTEMYRGGSYYFWKSDPHTPRTSMDMIDFWDSWIRQYPIISLEDGLAENDWGGWTELTSRLGHRVQIVGDDIFVTNTAFLARGIDEKCANSILVKLNQIGTLTETLQAVRLAQDSGFTTVISHRSGETEDTTIADLAVGVNAGQIKTGSACRSDRIAKYNQLLRIEEFLGADARFPGVQAFRIS